MDPVTVSLPYDPENGLLVTYSLFYCTGTHPQEFSLLLEVGMQYYSKKKMGLSLTECCGDSLPSNEHARDSGRKNCSMKSSIVYNGIFFAFTSTFASTRSDIETSFLMSAIKEESIHVDGLYIFCGKIPKLYF